MNLKALTAVLLLLMPYPLPLWKILSLAIHKLPRSSHLRLIYTRSDGIPCTFTFSESEAEFVCKGQFVWKVSFPQSLTLYTDSCEKAFVSFLGVMASIDDEEMFEGIIKSTGIDTSQIGVQRWEGDIAVVVGFQSSDAPQIWFHQEEFVPVFLRLLTPEGERVEIRMSSYIPVRGLKLFPSVVKLLCGAEEQMRFIMSYGNP